MAYQFPPPAANARMMGKQNCSIMQNGLQGGSQILQPPPPFCQQTVPAYGTNQAQQLQPTHQVFETHYRGIPPSPFSNGPQATLFSSSVTVTNQQPCFQFSTYRQPPLPTQLSASIAPPGTVVASPLPPPPPPPPTNTFPPFVPSVMPRPPTLPWAAVPQVPPPKVAVPTTVEIKQDKDLRFIPISLNAEVLTSMTETIQKQAEDTRYCMDKFLKSDCREDNQLPEELTKMFQPLYCKLCLLTLSSPIVAMDHYKGKKHKKKIEQWLTDYKIRASKEESDPIPIGGQVVTVDGVITRVAPEKNLKKQGQKKHGPLKRRGPAALHYKSDAKKKKKTEGGPNFDFCSTCQISLTSQIVANQHYNGKSHKSKLRQQGMASNSVNLEFEDRTFGIGKAFQDKPLKPVKQTTTNFDSQTYWDGATN